MATFRSHVISNAILHFENYTKKRENYVGVQNHITSDIKLFVKTLYDFTKLEEDGALTKALPELIIQEFDEEQIWQELELQNEEKSDQFLKDVSFLVARKEKLTFPIRFRNEECTNGSNATQQEVESTVEDEDEDTLNVACNNVITKIDNTENNVTIKYGKHKKSGAKSSIVDDDFFKLRDLESFLDNEDHKESKGTKQGDEDGEDTDESVDYFCDFSLENEDEEEELHYDTFFDAPDGKVQRKQHKEDRDIDEDLNLEKGDKDKQVRFNLSEESNDPSHSNQSETDDSTNLKSQDVKSSYETRQERLKLKISNLEEKSLAEKPWQLMGEVSASSRPQNSLLEEVVEFDLTSRPAPIITEQTTLKLEDIICQRIKDKVWDDVERKVKPVETPNEYKKKLVLNQEKSKLSLAQVYEQEYLKQRDASNPEHEEREEEPAAHQEITIMMTTLFSKLDALSNFHYTPKPIAPDIKIISNIPAINMEEVAPLATSDATLLAPEEVKAKGKGDLIGEDERTKTDKKRAKRQKKAKQRAKQQEKEKREKTIEKMRPGLGNKFSKIKAAKMLEKVTKDKNVVQMEESNSRPVKSSKAFFTQLQEEVTSHIKSKTKSSKKFEKGNISAKKFKL